VTELLSNNDEIKSSTTQQGIEFVASVAKVNTLADLGIRVTLDLPEDSIVEAAWLMSVKREGCVVRCRLLAE